MTRTRLGRSSLVLGLALTSALAAVAVLAWIDHDQASHALTVEVVNPATEALISGSLARAEGEPGSAAIPRTARDIRGTSTPLRTEPSARVHAESRDARSGAAIPGLRLEFVEGVTAPEIARIAYASADRDGAIERDSFLVGRWRITASSARHRPLVLGTFETCAGKSLELGRITLEPLPVHRGRLIDAAGEPAAGNRITVVVRHALPDAERLVTVTDADGTFEVVGDLDRQFVIQVNPLGEQSSFRGQRFALENGPEDQELVLQLAVYQHLILNVYDISAEYPTRLINLCPAPDEPIEPGTSPLGLHGQHEPLVRPRQLSSSASTRRLDCYVAAGRYRVWGGVPTIALELREGLSECEFTISGH